MVRPYVEGRQVVAFVADDGRDLWASLAVADELERLANGNGGGGFRVVPAGEWPGPGDVRGALVVIASDDMPSARLRSIRRHVQTGDTPTTLLLVHASAE